MAWYVSVANRLGSEQTPPLGEIPPSVGRLKGSGILLTIIALDFRPETFGDLHHLEDQRTLRVLCSDFAVEPTEGARRTLPSCEHNLLVTDRALSFPVER